MSLAVSIGGSTSNPTLSPAPTNGELQHATGKFVFTNGTTGSIDYKVGATGSWTTLSTGGTFTVDASAGDQTVEIGTQPAELGPIGNVTVTLKKSRGY